MFIQSEDAVAHSSGLITTGQCLQPRLKTENSEGEDKMLVWQDQHLMLRDQEGLGQQSSDDHWVYPDLTASPWDLFLKAQHATGPSPYK